MKNCLHGLKSSLLLVQILIMRGQSINGLNIQWIMYWQKKIEYEVDGQEEVTKFEAKDFSRYMGTNQNKDKYLYDTLQQEDVRDF